MIYTREGSVDKTIGALRADGLWATKRDVIDAIRPTGLLKRAGVASGASKPRSRFARDGGRPLREARLAKGLRQRELAREASRLAVERAAAGTSQQPVSVSQALVSELERRYGMPVSIERAKAIAGALGAEVGHLFTLEAPPAELCGSPSQECSTPSRRRQVEAAEAFAMQHGWLTTAQAAERLGVAQRTVIQYEELGKIRPVAVVHFGLPQPFKFWAPEELARLDRKHWASTDGRTAAFRDPEKVRAHCVARGLDAPATERAVARARRRRARYVGHAVEGAGRPPINAAVDTAIETIFAADPFCKPTPVHREIERSLDFPVSLRTVERRLAELRQAKG